jgi:hypothetical protein
MITLGVIALAVLLVLLIINRFIFSWGGLLLSGASLCKYKTISVPTNNGRNQPLAQTYDLHEIARVMKTRDGYEVNDHASGGLGLVISRTFDAVKYNITFEQRGDSYGLNLSTYNFAGYPNGSVDGGERCTAPASRLEKRIFQVIDDMPLNSTQREELKDNVRVINVGNLRLTF